MKIPVITIYFLLICVVGLPANERYHIGLFHQYSIESAIIRFEPGMGMMVLDQIDTLYLHQEELVYCTYLPNGIFYRTRTGSRGLHQSIAFIPGPGSIDFSVQPIKPQIPRRKYSGVLSVRVGNEGLSLINEVVEDDYLAAVTGAEGGNSDQLEYLKAQVVLARTFLLKNIDRHRDEGFNLCDDVHCQSYKGTDHCNELIYQSVAMTGDSIITGSNGEPIMALFHANCGGHTESSDRVWLEKFIYCKPVIDTHCLESPGAKWEKRYTRDEWLAYLVESGLLVSEMEDVSLEFRKQERFSYYVVGEDSVSAVRIREDLELRSAFFSVFEEADSIVIMGRGYGHGVGLCQEGAMSMARKGHTYRDILDFYLSGIRISASTDFEK